VSRIVSLNIGRPKDLAHKAHTVRSAIARTPVTHALELGFEGFVGDQVADTKNHGGPDRAVNVYAFEHYAYWQDSLGRTLDLPSFGENFTLEGALETDVCIGDTFLVGSSVLQVSQPRVPCFKPAALHGEPHLTKWIQDSGFTGWYFRVLTPGQVAPGDQLVPLSRSRHGVSIAEANRVMHHDHHDQGGLMKLLSVPELAQGWQRHLQIRLDKLKNPENP
jgi:MOSC domain-containing protein YiiM